MSDVPMPSALTEEAVAEWVHSFIREGLPDSDQYTITARAVLALVEAKVREAVRETKDSTDPRCDCDNSGTGGRIHIGFDDTDAIVARVLGRDGGCPVSPRDAGNRNASAPDVREADATLRKAVGTALLFLEHAVVTKGAVSLRDVAGARPLITSLRAALASPVAAPVSPPAASRDAVAEVLLHEAHPDLAPWSLLQLSGHNSAGLVCAVALARRQADAILSRWSAPPAPRGEAVELGWTMLRADGMPTGVMSCERGKVERICDEHNRDEVAGFPFRVVALVPRKDTPNA